MFFECSGVKCPECRSQHDLPSEGVKGFLTNFIYADIIELFSLQKDDESSATTPGGTMLKCENEIDDNPAFSKCLQCNFFLCEDCTTLHKKQRSTKTHEIATLRELEEGVVQQPLKKHYCSEHKEEELKVYCRTCQKVVCRDCTFDSHKQHDYILVEKVQKELTREMERLMSRVAKKKEKFQSYLYTLDRACEKEQLKLTSHKAKTDKLFDDSVAKLEALITSLRRHQATLNASIDDVSSEHHSQLLAQKEVLQTHLARIMSGLTFPRQLISLNNATHLAMMNKEVCTQLHVLTQLQWHDEQVADSQWSVGFTNENLRKSKVIEALSDAIIVSKVPNPALLGKNTFQVSLKNMPAHCAFDMTVEVRVDLPSGESCPVKTQCQGQYVWLISFFISPPCPEQVTVVVAVNDIPPKDSPFRMQCRNMLAGGTRVQVRGKQKKGTVSIALTPVYQSSMPYHIDWDDGDKNTNSPVLGHLPISNLQILPE